MLAKLSTESVIKVFNFLEQDFDYSTIAKLRRANYKIRCISDSHRFDQIKAWEVRIELLPTNRSSILVAAGEDGALPSEMVASYSIPNEGYTNSLMSTFHIISEIPMAWYRGDESTHLVDESIFEKPADRWFQKPCCSIKNAFDQVKSVHTLTLQRMEFNNNVISEVSEYNDILSTVEALQITFCRIKITEEELTKFLEPFTKLSGLRIEGKFDTGIVTDQHLMSARDYIHIRNGKCYLTGSVMSFPGITDNICRQWMENMPNTVCFEGVATGMSFPVIMELVKNMINNKSSVQRYSSSRHFTLGTMYSNRQLQKEIVLAQRTRGVNWETKKTANLKDRTFIWTKDQSLSVLLYIDRAAETPDFQNLLILVNLLRDRLVSGGTGMRTDYLRYLSIKESDITEEVALFCRTCKIAEKIQAFEESAGTSTTETPIEAVAEENEENQMDEDDSEEEPDQWEELMSTLDQVETNIRYLAEMVPKL